MHISDGVLSAPVLIAGGVVALAGVGVGLASTRPRDVPKVAMVAATFFIASFIHVPIGPVQMHLVLVGLAGLLLGRMVLPAILVALTLQFILFGYGGLTTLGVNTCVMGLPAITIHYLLRRPLRGDSHQWAAAAGFAAGVLGVVFAATLLLLVLTLAGESFAQVAKFVFLAHLPLALVEGVLTLFVVSFLRQVRPTIFTTGDAR